MARCAPCLAQQVRTLVGRELGGALSRYDALLCPAASTLAYKVGEKVSDPLAMYSGDLATVNINLAGLPAIVLPCGHTQTVRVGHGWGKKAAGRLRFPFCFTFSVDSEKH